jgi:hypothetical protein
MLHKPTILKVQRLEYQLAQLKEIYEERLMNGKEFTFLNKIEMQILELERAIRNFD